MIVSREELYDNVEVGDIVREKLDNGNYRYLIRIVEKKEGHLIGHIESGNFVGDRIMYEFNNENYIIFSNRN